MLIAWVNGERVEADRQLERRQAFKCPGCQADVILKAGSIKIAHFAHKPGSPVCAYSVGETVAHLTAKKLFCEAARERGLRAELEYPVGDQRADVAIWAPNGKMLVIEIQHTPIDVDELKRRILGYRRKGISHIWVPTIKPGYGNDEGKPVSRYSIRPFERYLAKIYKGLWFYAEGDNRLAFCEVGEHMLCYEGGYDYNGDYHHGYYYKSARWVDLFPRIISQIKNIKYCFVDTMHGIELLVDDDVEPISENTCDAEIPKPERVGLDHWCGTCGKWGSWGYPDAERLGVTQWFCFEHRLP
jgi:hypothetical protein